MSSSEPSAKKTSYAYAWSGGGDLYDQAYALNRGRLRRSQAQMREHPELLETQRKQSSMPVIASSPKVREDLLRKHQEKADEIADDRIQYPLDIANSKQDLAAVVSHEADQTYGWYNPMRYLYRHWGATDSTAYASDSPNISHRRAVVRAHESMLAGIPEEEQIHRNMTFMEMKDVSSGQSERDTRKLHLLGHGGAGFPAFTTVQAPGQDASKYKLFDELAGEFRQQDVLDKFSDIRMESCWSANPTKATTYSTPSTYLPVIKQDEGSVKRAPGVHLQRQLKEKHPGQDFTIRAYEGRGSQISNPIGQKQRNLTDSMDTVRQSSVAHTFSSREHFK